MNKPESTISPRLLWLGGTGLALILMVIHGLSFRFVIDDAFISFRYAQNLVAGHGLVFNPGERVEGYSNLLYVLYSALGLKLGLDPLLWGRIGSTLAMGGVLAMLPGIVRQINPRTGSWVPLAAQLVLAAVGAVACWMLAGLETALFTLCVVWAWRAALKQQGLAAGVAGLLMILTRPEGPALAALFMGWALWARLRSTPEALRRWPTWVGPLLLILGTAAFFLWRHAYFGYWLPNTYYAKTGDLAGQLKTGAPYTRAFLLFYGLPLAVALFLALRRGGGTLLRRAQVWPGLGILAFWALYTTAIGGDMLGMFRFYVPVLPLLTSTVVALLAETGWLDRPRGALTAALILMVALLPATFKGKERRLVDIHMSEANLGGWFLAGDALAEHLPAGSTIALGPAGYIPYITGFHTWDFYGIITPEIAHRDMPFSQGYAGHEKHDGAYIVAQRPDYILIGNVDVSARPRQGLIRPHVRELDIVQNKAFQRDYEQVYLPVAGGKVLNLFPAQALTGSCHEYAQLTTQQADTSVATTHFSPVNGPPGIRSPEGQVFMRRRDALSFHAPRPFQIPLGLLILVMLLMPGYSRAQGLTEKEQLPIFMKVLSYDRTFKNVPATSLRLGILFRPDHPTSVAGEREMRAALDATDKNGPQGMAWNHESVSWTSSEELARKLTGSEIDILYVTPGQEALIPIISRWTRSLDILTLAPGHGEVDLGLSVGLAFHAERPRIAVNLKALEEEGHELDSRILRLCKVVRE